MYPVKCYKHWQAVPPHIRQQLLGLGWHNGTDSMRTIASGNGEDDGRVLDTLAVICSWSGRVLSWGILYWDDYGCYEAQGIQLYTRVSERRRGYGRQVYTKLLSIHNGNGHSHKPIISTFRDNISFWKKVGAVPKHIHNSMLWDRTKV